MLNTILKLNGAQELSRNEQKTINGGGGPGLCQVGCAGLWDGAACYASGVPGACDCPGFCSDDTGSLNCDVFE